MDFSPEYRYPWDLGYCMLCLTEFRKSTVKIKIDEKIGKNKTIRTALWELNFNIAELKEKSQTELVCTYCFERMKATTRFLDLIKSKHNLATPRATIDSIPMRKSVDNENIQESAMRRPRFSSYHPENYYIYCNSELPPENVSKKEKLAVVAKKYLEPEAKDRKPFKEIQQTAQQRNVSQSKDSKFYEDVFCDELVKKDKKVEDPAPKKSHADKDKLKKPPKPDFPSFNPQVFPLFSPKPPGCSTSIKIYGVDDPIIRKKDTVKKAPKIDFAAFDPDVYEKYYSKPSGCSYDLSFTADDDPIDTKSDEIASRGQAAEKSKRRARIHYPF